MTYLQHRRPLVHPEWRQQRLIHQQDQHQHQGPRLRPYSCRSFGDPPGRNTAVAVPRTRVERIHLLEVLAAIVLHVRQLDESKTALGDWFGY